MGVENKRIRVSVYCAAYNHSKYISETLEGFVKQKTSFDFEVIVHDDCSTDGTDEIIKEYAQKYSFIKPFFETENQYSKGIKIFPRLKSYLSGDYIALCEGDDFWFDEYKLQRQFDYLEAHKECALVCHSGYYVDQDGYSVGKIFGVKGGDRDISTKELIEQWVCPTASIMYRKKMREESSFPILKNAPCGDYPLLINLSLMGSVHYLDLPMCVYRNNPTSVTHLWKNDVKKMKQIMERFLTMLDVIDNYTGKKYTDSIEKMRVKKEFEYYIVVEDKKSMKNERYEELYKKNRHVLFKNKLKRCCPSLVKMFRKIRRAFCGKLITNFR